MSRKNSTRMVVLIATLAAFGVVAYAQQNQNQNTNQTQNQQAQPSQQTQPNQTTQQPQKKSIWQKMRDASQAGQNAVQQGSNTIQQGSNTVQQNKGAIQQAGQQAQNGVQQFPNGAQQVPNGAQQISNGVQQGTDTGQGAANGFQSAGGAGTCGPSCFDAGPFQANVSQMTMSQEGGWHVIRMNIQFHNATNQPLVIAYHDGSMVMVDNNGNTYIPAGGNPGQLQGMGIDRGAQTDSQFQLGAGQTRSALFSVARGRAANSPVGTSYSYNFTIDELQLQNGALAIPVQTYNLNFPTLAPGTSNAGFTSGSSPANGFVGNNGRAAYAGTAVPAGSLQSMPGNVQSVPGQAQPGVAAQQQQMVNGRPVTYGGTAVPQGTVQSAPGNVHAVPGQVQPGVAAQQQRMVNGRPATVVPTQTTPASSVNNAAMKTPVSTTARTPTAQPAAVKPSPATPAAKPATTAPPKKAPATANTK